MSNDANDFLMSGGVKSAKFEAKGATVKGTIVREPELQQQRDPADNKPQYWDEAKTQPKKQLKVVLATDQKDDEDDNGERAIYLKSGLLKAVQDAVKKAGAKGLAVGGKLSVKYVKDGEKKNKAFNAPKIYLAKYEAPDPMEAVAAAEPAEDEGLDDF